MVDNPIEEPEEIRLDTVKQKVDVVKEKVDVVADDQSNFRKAAAIICVAFIAALGINGAVLQRFNADARARDKRTICEGGNAFRRYDLERWQYILKLAGPAQDAKSQALRDKFVHYINAADALRNC